MSSDDDPVTQVACPAKGCERGERIIRVETRTGYSVRHEGPCAFCDGKGVVSPTRAAAWRKLEKLSHG